MTSYLRVAWSYRYFVLSAIQGEFKGRFATSRVGALWYILHPLAMALIYALVLSKVLGARLAGVDNEAAYSIFLLAGIAVWGLFSELVSRGLTMFLDFANTMKKVSFPRVAIPVIVLGNALLNHLFLVGAVAVVLAFLGHVPTVHWIVLPICVAATSLLALGLGVLLGVLNVFARDIGQVMAVVLNLWFWLTPIVYPPSILPKSMQQVIALNPVEPLTTFYQDIILHQRWPDFLSLAYPVLLGAAFAVLGAIVFRRANAEMVDVL